MKNLRYFNPLIVSAALFCLAVPGIAQAKKNHHPRTGTRISNPAVSDSTVVTQTSSQTLRGDSSADMDGPGYTSRAAKVRMERAFKALEENDCDTAVEQLQPVRGHRPQLNYLIGLCYIYQDNFAAAETYLEYADYFFSADYEKHGNWARGNLRALYFIYNKLGKTSRADKVADIFDSLYQEASVTIHNGDEADPESEEP